MMVGTRSYIISTERLGLRKWMGSDTQPFVEMNRDPEVMKYFPKMLSEQESIGFINRIRIFFDEHAFGVWAVEKRSTNEFIGYTGFSIPRFDSFFTPCIEIGWRYKKEAWGKGYATEAASACLRYGFDDLGFNKVLSFTSVLNLNSEKVMKRIGMTRVGEFDHPKIETHDRLCRHVLYQSDRPVPPA
jgi:RimJ/RimL family protein N-acetyltransferase